MNDKKARKIFRKLKVGCDYIWDGQHRRHDTAVMRILTKSLQQGAKPGVSVSVRWFFMREDSCGEGSPAGANWDWQSLKAMPAKWTGRRPTTIPIHAEHYCNDCGTDWDGVRDLEPGATHCDLCHEEARVTRCAGGEHDATCVCDDCKGSSHA